MTVPEKPSLEGLEAKWRALWEEQGTFRFDRTKTRDQIFAIDTPPPTVSGSLHIGHCMRTEYIAVSYPERRTARTSMKMHSPGQSSAACTT